MATAIASPASTTRKATVNQTTLELIEILLLIVALWAIKANEEQDK